MAFKVGDRVRFVRQGYEHQDIGFEDVVVQLDSDGLPILATDSKSPDDINGCGWPDDGKLELVEAAPDYTPTLRDQFAMAALTGLLSTGGRVDDETIREAYLAANLMLAAREAK